MSRKKKKYNLKRKMTLVCVKCRMLWKLCGCPLDSSTAAWILVNDKELKHYFNTGLVPDYEKELLSQGKVEPVMLEHPPKYGFKV